MKKSILLMALLALTPVVYAHEENASEVRESVLNFFSRFNPAVLEKAKQDPEYNTILELFVESYQQNSDLLHNPYDLIAAIRNFDRSIQMHDLTTMYHQLWLSAKVSGGDIAQTRQAFRSDVLTIMKGIWATTVNVREYQLEHAKQTLKQMGESKEFASQQAGIKAKIKALKQEIKRLHKESGSYIVASTDDYVNSIEQQFMEEDFAQARRAAQQYEQAVTQTDNVQIKTDHKKPVAK